MRKEERDYIIQWSADLSNYTGIPIEQAVTIAENKIAYREEELRRLRCRQFEQYSKKRAETIKQKENKPLLDPIVSIAHAYRILNATKRHRSTDYDEQLEHARIFAKYGLLKRAEVKEYALTHKKSV